MRNISNEDLLRDSELFGQLLLALGRKASLRDPIASTCEEFNITPAQIHAVMWLGTDGTMPMGELARLLRTTEKTVTGLVDRLEREGLAKRVRDEKDRRVVHVALTKKGATAHLAMQSQMRAKLNNFIAMLDSSERKTLLRILQKVVERLGAPGDPEPVTKESP